jgi:hypothetical protein
LVLPHLVYIFIVQFSLVLHLHPPSPYECINRLEKYFLAFAVFTWSVALRLFSECLKSTNAPLKFSVTLTILNPF